MLGTVQLKSNIGTESKSLRGTEMPGAKSASLLCVMIGAIFFFLSSGSIEPLAVAIIFLLLGMVVTYFFVCNIPEQEAFLLSFGICVMVGGISQFYSQTNFDLPMSTLDANTFYNLLKSSNRPYSFSELEKLVNAPLAVYTWQYIYNAFELIQFDRGPWIGVMFNALLVGFSSIFTVKSAGYVFYGDVRKLRSISVIFALCGMFWLYGSLFLRDSFVLLTDSVAIWSVTRMIARLNIANMTSSMLILSICALSMTFLRDRAVYIIALFLFVGITIVLIRRSNALGRIIVILLFVAIVMLQSIFMNKIYSGAVEAASYSNEAYSQGSKTTSGAQSLGVAIIVNQSLPIKAILGSVYLLVFPVPIWGYLQPGLGEYNLIRGWHAIYMAWLVPLFISGIVCTAKRKTENMHNLDTLYFMIAIAVISLALVSVTSLETRHYGQFLPAMIIAAALPDKKNKEEKKLVTTSRVMWLIFIATIHIIWITLRT